MTVTVQIRTEFKNNKMRIPEYATVGSAGFDLQANLDPENTIRIIPTRGQVVIPTGIFVAIPEGYELQIRPRSGFAAKHGIMIVNSPGTIDSDYRGEIGVILASIASLANYTLIAAGDRIAQAVLSEVEQVNFEEVEVLNDTERGTGGFGSTGKKAVEEVTPEVVDEVEPVVEPEVVEEPVVVVEPEVVLADVVDADEKVLAEVVVAKETPEPTKKPKKKRKARKKILTGADLNK
jgi:dUTP pyrophosphatase